MSHLDIPTLFCIELLLDGLDDDEEEPYLGESLGYSNSFFIELLLDGLDDGLDTDEEDDDGWK